MDYAQPTDLMARFDQRTLGDLVNDTGVRLIGPDLVNSVPLQTALSDASSMITAAAQFSQRYTKAELQALTGDDQALLFRLNCNLAFGLLNLRRGNDPGKFPAYVEALEMLESLRKGETLFNVQADVSVGTPAQEFPNLVTLNTVNTLRWRAGPLFPTFQPQIPSSGGYSS